LFPLRFFSFLHLVHPQSFFFFFVGGFFFIFLGLGPQKKYRGGGGVEQLSIAKLRQKKSIIFSETFRNEFIFVLYLIFCFFIYFVSTHFSFCLFFFVFVFIGKLGGITVIRH